MYPLLKQVLSNLITKLVKMHKAFLSCPPPSPSPQLSSVVTQALPVMAECFVWMEQHFLTQSFTPAWTATCSLAPPPGSVRPMGPGQEHSPTVPVSYLQYTEEALIEQIEPKPIWETLPLPPFFCSCPCATQMRQGM